MIDTTPFRTAAKVYPQPVAAACGRLPRAHDARGQLEACLKGAEVLCRYMAALALASLRCREDGAPVSSSLEMPDGNLNFGDYLSLVQSAAKVKGHPLAPHLAPFRARSRARGRGRADKAMGSLVELRNDLGHGLAPTSEVKARNVLQKHEPHQRLLDALSLLEGSLNLPLFVLHGVRIQDMGFFAQRLLLMGESPDPVPREIHLLAPLHELTPYVAFDETALPMPPAMLFVEIEAPPARRLALIDAVKEDRLVYKTLDSEKVDGYDEKNDLEALLEGEPQPPRKVRLAAGAPNMPREWVDRRRRVEAAHRATEGTPPWSDYDQETIGWYANRLSTATATKSAAEVIAAKLLDERTTGLTDDELSQLLLLFGTERAVKRALGRATYDFRRRSSQGPRWDERDTGSRNILSALQSATTFFATHMGLDTAETEDLTRTEGSADYIAMREALVNQFIHQDFSDSSAAAQVDLLPERAVFFNTGHSFVDEDALTDGGRSQARNPLIALALRLIGYAELGGSGIRTLQYEWRQAKRRPPQFDSDRLANTFTLTLDWREVPNAYDRFWKDSLGVEVNADQAKVLDLATDPKGITAHQAAAGTGLLLDDARDVLAYLTRQVLLEEKGQHYHLAPHLREALG